jgi:DNA topoisomerase-2
MRRSLAWRRTSWVRTTSPGWSRRDSSGLVSRVARIRHRPRYIHTYLQPIVRKLVPEADFPVLTYRDDDGLPVEPEWYAPVLPMLLVNGARGIGTGYSTSVPPYNPDGSQADARRLAPDGRRGRTRRVHSSPSTPRASRAPCLTRTARSSASTRKEKDDFVVTELPPGTWTAGLP